VEQIFYGAGSLLLPTDTAVALKVCRTSQGYSEEIWDTRLVLWTECSCRSWL